MHEFAMANGHSVPVAIEDPESISSRKELLRQMHDVLRHDRSETLDLCYDYYYGKQLMPFAPRDASDQIRDLQARSVTNLVTLLVNLPAQVSYVDGYRRGVDGGTFGRTTELDGTSQPAGTVSQRDQTRFSPEYDVWQKCRMDARQATIYRAAAMYGHAFVYLNNLYGPNDLRIELLSTRNTVAFFDDPINDIRPRYVLTIKSQPIDERPGLAIFWDETARYEVYWNLDGDYAIQSGEVPHGFAGAPPIVRYTCYLDDEGRSMGLVEPAIPHQNRVNQAVFSTNITADFGAFKVRTAAGLVPNVRIGADGEPMTDPVTGGFIYEPVVVSQSRMLLSDDPTTKFSQLDETPLDGYLKNEDAAMKNMMAAAQFPIHMLLGNVSQMSAEALAALEAQFTRFCEAFQCSLGESHEELFRLIAEAQSDAAGATSFGGEVRWRDKSQKSFAAVVEGLSKIVTELEVPKRAAWALIPGITSGKLADWEELKEEELNSDMFTDPRDDVGAAANRERAVTRSDDGGANEPTE